MEQMTPTASAPVAAEPAPAEAAQQEMEVPPMVRPASAAPVQSQSADKFIPARKVVQDIMIEDELESDGETGIIVVEGVAETKVGNPAERADFSTIRNMMLLRAYLNAKANIIRAIDTQFESFDRASLRSEFPESDLESQFRQMKTDLEAKREQLAKMLKTLDEKEADALKGVTIRDRFDSVLDALIKRLDKAYDRKTVSQEKVKEYEAFKAKCEAVRASFEELRAQAEVLPKFPKEETSSDIKMLSKMPLMGASIYCQAESWNPSTKAYQVAIICVWSPKLMRQAEQALTSADFKTDVKGEESIMSWYKRQDFGSMIGSRRLIDNRGRVLFIGIGASEVPASISEREAAETYAEIQGVHFVAISLLGDLESYRELKENYKVYTDDLSTSMRQLAKNTTQRITANLRGCHALPIREVVNPISGKACYISVNYLDPALAAKSADLMKESFAKASAFSITDNFRKGEKAGMEQAYDAARNSPASYQQGVKAGAAAVVDELAKEKAAAEAKAAAKPVKGISNVAAPKEVVAPAAKAKPTGGSFSGDTKASRKNFGL